MLVITYRCLEQVPHVFINSFNEEIQCSNHNRQLVDNKIAFSLSNTFTQISLYKMICFKTAENLFLHSTVFKMSLPIKNHAGLSFLSFFKEQLSYKSLNKEINNRP